MRQHSHARSLSLTTFICRGTGFLHCIVETPPPFVSPSSSGVPTSKPSTSLSPTDVCFWVEVNIFSDGNPYEISWVLNKIGDENGNHLGGVKLVKASEDYSGLEPESLKMHTFRLCEGMYEFTIRDSYGDGIADPGYYSLTSDGAMIVEGGQFEYYESTAFALPFVAKPTIQPPDATLVDNDDVDVEVEDTATQEELIATFNDITDQTTAVESDDVTVEMDDDTVEIPPQPIPEVNPDEPFN